MFGERPAALVHDHDRLQGRRQPIVDPAQHREQGGVDEQRRVLRLPDDEGELVGEDAGVERVEDASRAGDAVVELQVAVVVPAQRRHPVAAFEAEAIECAGDAGRAREHVAVGVSVDAARDLAGDDLAPEELVDPPHHVLCREREIHHLALHG